MCFLQWESLVLTVATKVKLSKTVGVPGDEAWIINIQSLSNHTLQRKSHIFFTQIFKSVGYPKQQDHSENISREKSSLIPVNGPSAVSFFFRLKKKEILAGFWLASLFYQNFTYPIKKLVSVIDCLYAYILSHVLPHFVHATANPSNNIWYKDTKQLFQPALHAAEMLYRFTDTDRLLPDKKWWLFPNMPRGFHASFCYIT